MGIVRLFLACVVVIDHWRAFVLNPQHIYLDDVFKLGFNAGAAVLFFYIISGFLITYTLSRNYAPTTVGALEFYMNRFIRIFSLYWPVAILTLLLYAVARWQFLSASIFDQFTGIFLFGLDWSMAFSSYPNTHSDAAIHGLEQAWTLGAELTFYLLAPLLMKYRKIIVVLLVLSFGLRTTFVWWLGPDLHEVWTYRFIATTFGFFMLGQLSCLAAQRFHRICSGWFGAAALILSATSMALGSYVDFDTPRFWLSALCFVFALPGIFHATKKTRVLNYLGDLSYPVYIVHVLIILAIGEAVAQLVFEVMGGPSIAAGYVTVTLGALMAIIAGIIAHHLIEKPCARLMRRVFLRKFEFKARQVKPAEA
jgi:peptidoglycan/LPS O-acetylase OafA/YrhL